MENYPGGLSCICFSTCGQYLVCAGSGTSEILVYSLKSASSSADNLISSPICTISVSGYPKSLQVESHKKNIDILVLYEDIDACFVRITNTNSQNCLFETCQIRTGIKVEAAYMQGSPESILIALKTHSKLLFSTVACISNGILKGEITPSITAENVSIVDNSVPIDLSSSVLVGPLGMGSKKKPKSNDDDNDINDIVGSKRQKIDGSSEDEDGNESRVGQTGTSRSLATIPTGASASLTLEERLESFSAGMQALERSVTGKISETETPTSDSLVTLIDQALQSGDDTLLEQCLACEDTNVIDATASRLGINRVVSFMQKLVSKFEKRPSRGILLTRWLSALLRNHTSFLISVPDLAKQLCGLSQMLEQRLSSYSHLTSLSGRLDLLMTHASARTGKTNEESIANASAPSYVYKEE